MDHTTLLANAVTKALAYTENGGAPDIEHPKKGKSGEMKSIFQYTPETWKHVSQEVYGKDVPLTADSETYATNQRITKWLKAGKTVPQIASMWNAGEGEPDAYTGKFSNGQSSKGTNKYKVAFNVPDYAKKVNDYSKEFLLEKSHQHIASQPKQAMPENDSLQSVLSTIKQAQASTPQPSQLSGASTSLLSTAMNGSSTNQPANQ